MVGEGGSGEGGEEGGPQRKDNKKKPDPDDPQFVPRGRFFMHDDRYGGKGPGPRPPRQRPDDAYDAEQEDIWMHDGYERLAREERDGRKGRSRRRGKQAAGGGRGGGAAAAPEPGVAVADGGAQHPSATAAASPAAGRGESGKRARGKGQRQPSGGRGTQQAGANQPVQDHATSPMGNGVAGGSKRYSSQRVATTDEAASLAAKAVAAAVSSTGAPINPAVAAAGGGHSPHFAPGGYASSPIRPNAQPFRPKGRGNGASTLYVPMGYGPYVPEYGAGATYYPPPPAFPAYGYTQGGQFPEPNNYLEPDPAIIDASVPTYQMAAAAAAPAPPTEAGGPDPTMMNPQLTPYGAYPPPFFYTAPVYHPYMGDHQSGGGRGRGRGRGHHHMAPPPMQGTVYYPPPVIEGEAEGMYEEQDRFGSSAEETTSAEQVEVMNGNGHDNGNGHGEDATSLAPQQQPQPLPQPAMISPAAKAAGSKMRAKAPKWVPKAAANTNTNANTTPMSDAETAAS